MKLTEHDKEELLYALEYNHDTRTFPKNPKELWKEILENQRLRELAEERFNHLDKNVLPSPHMGKYEETCKRNKPEWEEYIILKSLLDKAKGECKGGLDCKPDRCNGG